MDPSQMCLIQTSQFHRQFSLCTLFCLRFFCDIDQSDTRDLYEKKTLFYPNILCRIKF